VPVDPLARVVHEVSDAGVVRASLRSVVGVHPVDTGPAVDPVLVPVLRAEEIPARTAYEELPGGRADVVVGLAGYGVAPAPAEQAIPATVAEHVIVAVPAADDVVAVSAFETRVRFGIRIVSMAFAGNGDPWILGQLNSATAITRLAGSGGVDGPMLVVTNNDAGSDDTALDLNVQSGEPPMTVNSQTRVGNLNADRLDGMNSTAFASYERTVIVSPVGTNAQNGQALLNALASIKDASASKPYLLYIEPETYDLGNRTLQMKQWVDIEGSGELNTIITSTVSSNDGPPAGTVEGADNTEMRCLTVQHTGTTEEDDNIAILNDSGSPRLTHVSAIALGDGGANHIGVSNQGSSQLTMKDVTASATGNSSRNFGVEISGGSTIMNNVTASASGSRNPNTGVEIENGNVTIRQSKLSATGPGQDLALASGGGITKIAVSQKVGGIQAINNSL
jgi:hypothetical protein